MILVKIKMISCGGHMEVTLPVWEAVEELVRLSASNRWVYIDGQFWNGKPDANTETVLLEANDISVTYQLCSG